MKKWWKGTAINFVLMGLSMKSAYAIDTNNEKWGNQPLFMVEDWNESQIKQASELLGIKDPNTENRKATGQDMIKYLEVEMVTLLLRISQWWLKRRIKELVKVLY